MDDYQTVIENMYGYRFQPGEKWTLLDEWLIVVHPDKTPRRISIDGKIEEIKPYAQ